MAEEGQRASNPMVDGISRCAWSCQNPYKDQDCHNCPENLLQHSSPPEPESVGILRANHGGICCDTATQGYSFHGNVKASPDCGAFLALTSWNWVPSPGWPNQVAMGPASTSNALVTRKRHTRCRNDQCPVPRTAGRKRWPGSVAPSCRPSGDIPPVPRRRLRLPRSCWSARVLL
jgi:hypothetical protein